MDNVINKELVNKLSNIIKQYDPYTAYIDDYKQYSDAVNMNCSLDQQFIHTCNEYGYHTEVSFCYSLAELLASGKFTSAKELTTEYLHSLINGVSVVDFINLHNSQVATTNNAATEEVEKEESTMKNENAQNETVNNETAVKEGEAMNNRKIKRICNLVKSYNFTQSMKDCKLKEELEKMNDKLETKFVEVVRKMGIEASTSDLKTLAENCKANHSTVEEGINAFITSHKEDKAMKNAQVVATNNAAAEKEESTMKKNNSTTATTNNTPAEVKEETIMNIPVPVPVPVPVAVPVAVEPISIQIGDGCVQDKFYPELNPELTPVKAAPVKIQNTAPVDAKVKTYNLMHLIGDHALDQKKKGYGTCISAYMVCAYIMQIEYGIKNLKNWMGKYEVTDEMKDTVKKVRNWLIEKCYLTFATFKDENGFSFFTHEYDGQGHSKMYDATKYQATGNKTTTTYRITKEMNKWYQK